MNIFLAEQNEVKAVLQAQSYFSDIPIVIEDKNDVVDEIDKALAQGCVKSVSDVTPKTGIALLILTPSGNRNSVKISVSIYENVPINTDPTTGINKRALDVLQNVIYYMGIHQPARGKKRWEFESFDSIQIPEASSVSYNAIFDAERRVTAAST